MDKKRRSKRHGAVSVLEYRAMGILPEAMFNFLALLGWSPGDDRQQLTREEITRLFSFEGIGKAGAVFDLQKLHWLNGQYIAQRSTEQLARDLRPALEERGLFRADLERERQGWFLSLLELLKPRARTLLELVEGARPFLTDALEYEPAVAEKHLADPETRARLAQLREALAAEPAWSEKALDETTRRLCERLGIGAGKLIHPTRLALTGRGVSPGLFEVMALLGRERTIERLDRMIAHIAKKPNQASA
jgi:glutamyl-tRNA synthetase